MLTNEQTLEKYGKTLEEWRALTPGQKSGLRGTRQHHTRAYCECGNEATMVRSGHRICQRCADIETQRGQDFQGDSIGETCGHGHDTTPYKLNLR